jgi:hypothetical protein
VCDFFLSPRVLSQKPTACFQVRFLTETPSFAF